jgi:hypothetical protein
MRCQYVVVSSEQPPQQCGKDVDFFAYQTALRKAHCEVLNKGGWLSRPGELKPVGP